MCLSLTLCVEASAADDGTWQLKRSRDGIKIYTRSIPGSKYKAVKSTMTIISSLSALAALMRDGRECPKWQAMCKLVKGIKIISPQEMYVYQISNLPWPVADRDAVVHIQWHQDKRSLTVTMHVNAVSGMKPPQPGLVRVTHASSVWTLKPTGHGMIKVTTEAHVNPGGHLPAWIVNKLLIDSPYKTLTNMRKIIATGRFDDAKVGFIKEPGLHAP